MGLVVYKDAGSNTVSVTEDMMEVVGLLQTEFPGIRMHVVASQAEFVVNALSNLGQEIIIGGVLSLLMILIFLRHWKSSVAIAIVLPLSVMMALVFLQLFDVHLVDACRRLVENPADREAKVDFVTTYHMVIEGMLALTGQHFIMDFNERQGTLPGFVQGFTLVARDEHRHVAFGARFLRDMARTDPRYVEAIQRTLVEVGPVADGVLKPHWMEGGDDEMTLFGVTVAETRAFAMKALERRIRPLRRSLSGFAWARAVVPAILLQRWRFSLEKGFLFHWGFERIKDRYRLS